MCGVSVCVWGVLLCVWGVCEGGVWVSNREETERVSDFVEIMSFFLVSIVWYGCF